LISASNPTINAAGHHTPFGGGSGDAISAFGGTETVIAFLGRNTIATAADDLTEPPQGGHGSDEAYRHVLRNQDVFDLRPSLAGFGWNGGAATAGYFTNTTKINRADTAVSIMPVGRTGGVSDDLATFYDVDLSTRLARALT
jgi:hypothetical protein